MPKKKSMLKRKRKVKRKKLKFKRKEEMIFLLTLIFILLILSFYLYFNYKKNLGKNLMTNATKETNLSQRENKSEVTSLPENTSRVAENVIIIGRGGKIKIVGE